MKTLVGSMLQHMFHSLSTGNGAVCPLSTSHCSQGFRAVPQGGIRAQGHIVLLSPSEPVFVGAYTIPDTYNPNDDKVYIFFRETAMDAGQWEQRHIHARVARVCKVSCQHPVACCPTRWAFSRSGPRSIPSRGM
ncbi:hypothetical protein EK904_003901 [Melospiza melodia maxima]|nr:hypothetical protein EK904_003901 [Melospiza melodia maxima]